MSVADLTRPEPPAWWSNLVDRLSWGLPALAALAAGAAGWAALDHADQWSAAGGVIAAILSAAGVIFTNLASRMRDRRLSVVRRIADLGTDMAGRALSRDTSNF